MQFLRWGVMLMLAGAVPVAAAQLRPLCSTVPYSERAALRSIGACRDGATIVDVAPKGAETAAPVAPPVVLPVPNVVGLSFDDARDRLPGFTLQRSYRPSAEPGGTVLEQQPAPPARVASGATVRVVLSDATLRPAPRVSGASVDESPKPAAALPEISPPPAVVTNDARAGRIIEQLPNVRAVKPESAVPSAPLERARVEQLRVPRVTGMSVKNAQARLGRFKVERRDRASSVPIGRVIEQAPRGAMRAPAGSAVLLIVSSGPAITETFELPNVVDRSYADASNALAEFKLDRIEVVASAAPSGQVLAQDPAPGTQVAAGSAVGLQVSDGSLAAAAVVVTPAVVAAPVPSPAAAAPVEAQQSPVAFSASTVPALIASGLLVLALVAMAMRRWLQSRRDPEIELEAAPPQGLPPSVVGVAPVSPAGITFSARLDEGETTIEFAAPSDADETTLEHSRELHE